jgi:hypothetical protein
MVNISRFCKEEQAMIMQLAQEEETERDVPLSDES